MADTLVHTETKAQDSLERLEKLEQWKVIPELAVEIERQQLFQQTPKTFTYLFEEGILNIEYLSDPTLHAHLITTEPCGGKLIGYWKIRYRDDETARSHPSHRRNLDCSGYYNPTTRTLFGDSEELIRQLDITLFDGSYSVPREPTRSPVETAQFNLKTLNNRLLSIVELRKIAHKDFVHECNQIPKDIKKIGEIVKLIRQFDSLINNFKVRIQSKKALLESMARRISTVSQPPE